MVVPVAKGAPGTAKAAEVADMGAVLVVVETVGVAMVEAVVVIMEVVEEQAAVVMVGAEMVAAVVMEEVVEAGMGVAAMGEVVNTDNGAGSKGSAVKNW